ncbi:MAG: outer membrane protein assembly factor BamD [Planctomycetota bacterium]|jgi:TolA-binding protein
MKQIILVVVGALMGTVGGVVAVHYVLPNGDPEDAGREPTRFDRAMSAVFAGDYEAAIERFAELERKEPRSRRMDQVLFWTAFCRRAKGEHGAAIETYDRLADRFPSSPRAAEGAYEAALIIEQDLGRPDEAMKRYNEIIRKYPSVEHKALVRIGLLHEQKREFDKAGQSYLQADESLRSRGYPNTNFNRRQSQSRNQFLTDNVDFERRPLALFTEAEALERSGRPVEAIKKCWELVRLYPESSLADDALAMVIRISRLHGKREDMEKALIRIEKDFPESEKLRELRK